MPGMHAECWKVAVTAYHTFMAILALGVLAFLIVIWRSVNHRLKNIESQLKRLNSPNDPAPSLTPHEETGSYERSLAQA